MVIGAQVAGQVFNSILEDAEALTLSQWHDFWLIPAIFVGAMLLFFIIFFDDKIIEDKEKVDTSDFKM